MTNHPEDNEVRVVRGCPTPDELAAAIVAVHVLIASRKTAGNDSSIAGRQRRQNSLRRWPPARARGTWRRSGWL